MGHCRTGETFWAYLSLCTEVKFHEFRVHIKLQERFMSLHPGFYHNAHAAILVFDVTRKSTYKNLSVWYKELRQYRSQIPVIVLANKIDENPKATEMQFNFAKKNNLEMNYSSGKYIYHIIWFIWLWITEFSSKFIKVRPCLLECRSHFDE